MDSPGRGMLWVGGLTLLMQVGVVIVSVTSHLGTATSRTDVQTGVLSTQMTELRETVRVGLADIRTQIASIPTDHAQLQQTERAVEELQPRVGTLEQRMYEVRARMGLDQSSHK